jgi:hypothetical protein
MVPTACTNKHGILLIMARNDILRKHGIIPEKPPSPTPIIEEAILEARRIAHEKRLEDKDLDELAALEDEEDEEFLEQYRWVPFKHCAGRAGFESILLTVARKKRLAELSILQKTSIHNQVYPLQKIDYAREVTEASAKSFVLVHLTSPLGSNIESRTLSEIWRPLASRFGDIKFCEIRADMCIEGYPERNTPTILIYRDGEIRRQIVTLRELNGPRTKIEGKKSILSLCYAELSENPPPLRRGLVGPSGPRERRSQSPLS